ncbi:MAG: cobalamin biosynthesis protein CobD [Bacteroidales bacterium]|nr:cobalamin biosynthesis protein CobD [Bacteroidales bacterium]
MYVIIGWLLDRFFGDPANLPHPIVYFGKAIAALEKRFNCGTGRRVKGAIVAIALVALVFAASWLLIHYAFSFSYGLGLALSIIGVFFCLAGKTLSDEVMMVFEAVDESLEKGRTQVGRIVGRDTSELSAQEIRTAALETLAENLSDGVVAPLFWCALFGVPGMLAYKMVNTLDSMIGYRNERYREFGCFAARLDDVANWIPARITALLMAVVAPKMDSQGRKMKSFRELLRFVRRYGSQHLSPNSGYPEAALAGILNCRFGGPHNYFGEEVYKPYIGEIHKDFTTEDMETALQVNLQVELISVLSLSFCIIA